MESQENLRESQYMDDDDVVPCKGCGNILEEGKAFELAGNRWHIDCFRCNSCGTLLDSDANLLLLGDGSLICNSCTYSCTACGNKIEDLAILTGDQAFCAGCFRCRNCKRKIENLKYARTSQGIFCMSCHETLMARKKKRQKPPTTRPPISHSGSTAPSPMLSLDKSLPSLPIEHPDHPGNQRTPRSRPEPHRTDTSRSDGPLLSPAGYQNSGRLDPRNTVHNKRYSSFSQASENSNSVGGDPDSYSFIPLVLDNSTADLGPAPLPNTSYNRPDLSRENSYEHYHHIHHQEQKNASRPVYDRQMSDSSSHYDPNRDRTPRPHIASLDRSSDLVIGNGTNNQHPSEFIVHELDGRETSRSEHSSKQATPLASREPSRSRQREQPPAEGVNNAESGENNARNHSESKSESFKLGEVPHDRKRSLKDENLSVTIPASSLPSNNAPASSVRDKSSNVFTPGSLPRSDSIRGKRPNPRSRRGESEPEVSRKPIAESPIRSTSSSDQLQHSHAASNPSADTSAESQDGQQSSSQESPKHPGIRLSTTTTVTNIQHETYPPSGSSSSSPNIREGSSHRTAPSLSSQLSMTESHADSPALPPLRSPVGGLVFDEELRRVFGGSSAYVAASTATAAATPAPPSSSGRESIGRRLSNTVKHGRSLSEAARMSPKWQRPTSAGVASFTEISSPISPDGREDTHMLRQELRRSTQRIAELEAKLNSTQSAKVLESNIQEKRMTVAHLETERETVLRELLVLKERMEASKESGKPLNLDQLKSDLISGLTRELEDLKSTLKIEIQALVAQRDQLMEDVETFGRLREQAIQETEQLNMKNAQLADLNNELTRRIQGQFNSNKSQKPGAGLGIYDGNSELASLMVDKSQFASSIGSMSGTPINETTIDGQVMVAEKIYKNGGTQQKKFFWKKPAVTMLKGAGKGFNKVFQSDGQRPPGDGYPQMEGSGAYESYPGTNPLPKIGPAPDAAMSQKKSKWGRGERKQVNGANGSYNPAVPDIPGNVPIFGGELDARVEFEGERIPNVVMKCIQEVEMRGMDMEGIYRKSGGATQMREIQDQFERGIDVQFDTELDICSVTSVLKQYFRNLPNPLITYEVYDRFIETSTMNDEETRVRALKEIIEDLPPSHRHVLQFVVFHLARVASRQAENLMTTRNLSVVFAPTLIRHLSDEREMSDMHSKNNALQFLIDYNEQIFD